MIDNNTMNVKIPLPLLFQILYLLECIDIDEYDHSIRNDYDNVFFALNKKKESLELREAYSKIIRAKDDDSRHFARLQYLEKSRSLRGDL